MLFEFTAFTFKYTRVACVYPCFIVFVFFLHFFSQQISCHYLDWIVAPLATVELKYIADKVVIQNINFLLIFNKLSLVKQEMSYLINF